MARTKESPSEPGAADSWEEGSAEEQTATEAFVAPEVDQAAQVNASTRNGQQKTYSKSYGELEWFPEN